MEMSRGLAADRHVPVMLTEILDALAPSLERSGALYVDATLGMGGHTEAVLERFGEARAIGIDRDTEALRLAGERLARFGDRFEGVHAVNTEVADVLPRPADAMLFDLGVSSLQLDELDRGFSYRADAPLDMRMDQTSDGPTAADVLNTASQDELERILKTYGEERFARKIAHAVVKEREKQPWTTSGRLVEMLRSVIPLASQRQSGHPAKRTFQALRIEVNDELRGWEQAVRSALDSLAVGGRLAVLSFHSLEDRITKRAFATASASTAPPGLPVELPEHRPEFALVTRGAAVPSEDELARNPRSASVRLRVIERTRAKGSQS
ncbi:16S rRNA (cytosine(1402)-N(4))-methyltransferase RsmH [Dermacoccus nishinomiyaensis]|uniref:16S rRNA (cytosine(1402)-N(4))-methyltransferase RsmH n=1 Tax=Dermacoccus TaxID=57495 RepID=UPI000938CEA7|nr:MULTISPECIES: 16S rRNA (cytosine(1402)-N(4))-methyltransferase RsmH [Dermacoccus]QQY25832.1 16S rRNA (cytosine(1402)-N(4))-methyltransferase RsmH [Dermacoccus nishinomiyaensis]TJZ97778.1 16S rRNA (cytosine(1402)-N(4))-methyltransferase RsmH [Dermacoccus nishinomiyaensis]STD16198.1 Ribosomal RNA small subunit methyltransferase H [Dermacoccus nishinomiyaensis]